MHSTTVSRLDVKLERQAAEAGALDMNVSSGDDESDVLGEAGSTDNAYEPLLHRSQVSSTDAETSAQASYSRSSHLLSSAPTRISLDSLADQETDEQWWMRIQQTREEKQSEAKAAAYQQLMEPEEGVGDGGGSSKRALVVMACGTGKTHVFIGTADMISADLVHGQKEGDQPPVIIVFEPNLELIRQTVERWHRSATNRYMYDAIAVCSLTTLNAPVGKKRKKETAEEEEEDESGGLTDEAYQNQLPDDWNRLAHDEKSLRTFLSEPTEEPIVRLVFCTCKN